MYHVYFVDIESCPGQMTHKLHEHNSEQECPHGTGVIPRRHIKSRQTGSDELIGLTPQA